MRPPSPTAIALDPANLDAYSRRARGHAKLMEYAAVADYTAILEQEAFIPRLCAAAMPHFSWVISPTGTAVLDEQASDATRMFNGLAASHLGVDAATEWPRTWKISTSSNRFNAAPANLLADVWPGPVAALFLGLIGPDELRAHGVASEVQTREERLAEVTFYLGQYFLARGDVAQARDHFQQTLATGVTNYFEYTGAVADQQPPSLRPPFSPRACAREAATTACAGG